MFVFLSVLNRTTRFCAEPTLHPGLGLEQSSPNQRGAGWHLYVLLLADDNSEFYSILLYNISSGGKYLRCLIHIVMHIVLFMFQYIHVVYVFLLCVCFPGAPLFDSSSNFTDPQTLQLLQHSQRLLSNLSTIFHCLLSEAQELTQKGVACTQIQSHGEVLCFPNTDLIPLPSKL